jgi:hypothetical protein
MAGEMNGAAGWVRIKGMEETVCIQNQERKKDERKTFYLHRLQK